MYVKCVFGFAYVLDGTFGAPNGFLQHTGWNIWCIKCSIQYVRETENALHICLTGHRSEIRHKRTEKPVARHFNLVDHSINDLTIMVIETIHMEDTEYRQRKESYWIEMIRSLAPDGLNLYS